MVSNVLHLMILLSTSSFTLSSHLNLGRSSGIFPCGAFPNIVLSSDPFLRHAYLSHMSHLMVMSSTILSFDVILLIPYFFEFSILQYLHFYMERIFFLALIFQSYLVNFHLSFVTPIFPNHRLQLVLLVSDIFGFLYLLNVFWITVAMIGWSATYYRFVFLPLFYCMFRFVELI